MSPAPGARRAASTPPLSSTSTDSSILSDVLRLVGDDLGRVEMEFSGHLGSDVDIIETVGRYIADGGGKRIRPALFLLCTKLCGYEGDRHILFASVFELIHTATLVHDDVIDGAQVRRGRASVNARWGSHLTVLLGDYLYLKSMTMALTADDLRIIKILCDITLTMIEGELMQADVTGSLDISEAEHLEIIRRKTAALFSGCGKVAGTLAGIATEQVDALEAYALNLGMAYQIIDDMLDFTSTETVLGKPVASDLKEGRITLPLIYLLEEGDAAHRETISRVLAEGGFRSVARSEILDLVKRNGTLEKTRRLAGSYSDAAVSHLEGFTDSPARQALVEIARYITAREF